MIEVIFLMALALIWLTFASIHDVKTTEVPDWLNFSLIAFALGFRFFYSLFALGNFSFFFQGLIGLGIFFVLGNVFYYSKMFAGGDAKLMIALGTILPFSFNFVENIKLFLAFLALFLISGAFFGIFTSSYFAIKNKIEVKKEFSKLFSKNKKEILLVMALGVLIMLLGLFSQEIIIYSGIFVFFSPFTYLIVKAIDESCMVRVVDVKSLREGDWLYKPILIGNKKILAKWEGLTQKEIKLIQQNKKFVKIKKGIPFVPVFLVSFVFLILVYFFVFPISDVLFQIFPF
ncbi:MAG TPA: prepilin peptidase [Candidatus Pacearchaeota archaeon]|nr:prepilin peptidase [Candidatus Pacearchaeota archaeon]